MAVSDGNSQGAGGWVRLGAGTERRDLEEVTLELFLIETRQEGGQAKETGLNVCVCVRTCACTLVRGRLEAENEG